jgi:urease accessory protein
MPISPPPVAPWQGCLNLRYGQRKGHTQLAYAEAQAPFKIQRPFYPEGERVCHSVILHTAGGIVGGDRLILDIQLDPGSHVLLTTAAASKIYRSNGQTAYQSLHITVGEGACLEWLPQEAIAFQGAAYHQEIQIELASGASVLLWDVIRFGRSARGERFLHGQVRSRTEVWQQGKPLWIDRQQLVGNEVFLAAPNAFANSPVLGSFAAVGLEISADDLQDMRSRVMLADEAGEFGMTRLQSGLLCRYRGDSSHQARQGFIACWDQLRQMFYQRSACIPRVWPI